MNWTGGGTKLLFVQQPTNAVAGTNISPSITVRVTNASNTTITTDNTTQITLAISTNPGGGTLAGTVTRTVVNGVATFNNLWIDKTGTGYQLTATSSPVLTSATSSTFNITAAALDHLSISPTPSTITAGSSRTYTVTGFDVYNNSRGTVPAGLSISPNGSCGATSCTATVAGSHTVTATFGGKTVTASLTVVAGAPDRLSFGQQPTNTRRNRTISPSITARVLDAYGNVVTSNNSVVVTIAISTNPSGGTLSGTKVRTVSNGVATFSGLSINRSGNGYRLRVTSPSLSSATSASFNITP